MVVSLLRLRRNASTRRELPLFNALDREITNINAWADGIGKKLSLQGLYQLVTEIDTAIVTVAERDERTELLILATIYRREIQGREAL